MLSVIVITKNEQDRIKTCLESVKWADEIIIVDNGSTDDTLKIAKKYTEKIYQYSGVNFADLRNFAMEKTKGDWVLYVDSDERVLEPLKEEILSLIKDTTNSAFAISRRNIIFGQEVRYGSFWPDWIIRLVKKSDFVSWVGQLHEYIKFNGELGYTKNSFLHLTHRGVDHFVFKKSRRWSIVDANLRFQAGHPKMSGWRFLRIFITELFNQGFLRGGFFGGTVGIIDSILQTFHLFLTYVRLWEMQQPKPLEKVYDEIDKKLLKNNFKFDLFS